MKKLILILLICVGVERFCYFQTAGFLIDKIAYTPTESALLAVEEPQEDVRDLLKQSFYFLGSGVQCYAFLGQDGQTVLKVFKHYHFGLPTPLLKKMWMPYAWKESLLEAREKRMCSILESCYIAGRDYKEETAMIYTHLRPTQTFRYSARLIDKIGISHTLDLDRTEFVLQKRAEPLFSHFDALMKQGDLESVQNRLDSIVDLILAREKKGIVNQDSNLYRNLGFLDGKAIEIDVGSFKKQAVLKQDLLIEFSELIAWTKAHYPTLSLYLEKKVNEASL